MDQGGRTIWRTHEGLQLMMFKRSSKDFDRSIVPSIACAEGLRHKGERIQLLGVGSPWHRHKE
eukprot:361921-Chlamydomonas_euryale.AAC.8